MKGSDFAIYDNGVDESIISMTHLNCSHKVINHHIGDFFNFIPTDQNNNNADDVDTVTPSPSLLLL